MTRTYLASLLSFRATRGICFFLFSLVALPLPAQVTTGTPPLGTFSGGPDVLNVANLNDHWTIPVFSKAGRGLNFNFYLTYDSSVWYPAASSGSTSWQPLTGYGWNQSEANIGSVTYHVSVSSRLERCGTLYANVTTYTYTNWTYNDGFYTSHLFGLVTTAVDDTCANQWTYSSAQGTATDNSGYYLSITGSTVNRLLAVNGNIITPNTGAGAAQDRNGNYISLNSSGVITDTLGQTALTMAGTGTPSSPKTFTYQAPSGGNAAWTEKFTAYTVQTNFGCSGITEYGPTSVNLPSEIDLPDGSKYSFTYEGTPGHSGNVTGRLASITLPTGGTITYAYSGGNNGVICADGSTATLERYTPDTGSNFWTYAHSESGTAWTTTVTDPQGNKTVYNFQGIYLTEKQVYSGSSTLLGTVFTCYNGAAPNCNATSLTPPISSLTAYVQWPSGTESETVMDYNGYGLLTEEDDHDYGSGSPGGLLRKTLISYATLGNNIVDMPASVTVQNGSGTTVAQTTYNYDGTTATATSGIAQHASVSGSRGNLTSINYPVSGLTASFTYYDTGSLNTSVDVNGAATTYNYSNNTADCQMAFPTSLSEPLSMSRSASWNCTGGVQLTATDENSQTSTTTWNDPYFWRPASVSYPDGGLTSWTYNSQTSTTQAVKMNSSQNITTTQLLDGLGRTKERQLNSDPEGVVYQDTTYDALGRVYTVSNPYRSYGEPSDGTTTYFYDALGRPTSTTLQDGSVAGASYPNNTVITTDPAGNKRTAVYNSLGWLTQVLEDPSGLAYETDYGYDALGDLLCAGQKGTNSGTWSGCSSIPSGWRGRTYTYDAMSRMTSEANPETGTITYQYDASPNRGDLTSRVAPAPNQTGSNTVTTTYAYDLLHRLTNKSYSDGATPAMYYYYDLPLSWMAGLTNITGRLVEAYNQYAGTAGEGTDTVNSYDAMGRVLQQWQQTPALAGGGDFLNYTYDLAGNLLTGTNGVGVTLTQTFDAAARLTQLTSSYVDANHPATLVTADPSVGYYPDGALRKMTFGNGLTQATEIEGRLQPCVMNINSSGSLLSGCTGVNNPPPGTVQQYGLAYGSWGTTNNSSITTMNAAGQQNFNRTYTYDSLNRLSTLSSPSDPNNCTGLSWAYDAWGNRTQQNLTGGTCPTFSQSVNVQNQLMGSPYQYDAAGNMIHDASHSYTYDAEDRMIQVDGTPGNCSTASACYTYDALGRRVEKTTGSTKVDYLYDLSGNAVTEWCTNCSGFTGWSKGYFYFSGSLAAEYANATTYFVHADHLGSARLLTGVGSNLIANPGFESGSSPWSLGNASVVTNSANAHSGNNYIEISVPANGAGSILGQALGVQPGDVIEFGGWAYLESGTGTNFGWWLDVEDTHNNTITWVQATPAPTTSSGWTFQSNTYTIPSGAAYVVLYGDIYLPSTSMSLRLDDGFLYDNRTSLQVVQNLDYLPFGELNSSDSGVNTHEFTGDEHDAETNLDHTWFRQYSRGMARWMNPDPAGLAAVDPTNPQSWNRYAYVFNNPLGWVDPLGLCGGTGLTPGLPCPSGTSVSVSADAPDEPTDYGSLGGGAPNINAEAQIFARHFGAGGTIPDLSNRPPFLPSLTPEQLCLSEFYDSAGGKAVQFGSPLQMIPGFGNEPRQSALETAASFATKATVIATAARAGQPAIQTLSSDGWSLAGPIEKTVGWLGGKTSGLARAAGPFVLLFGATLDVAAHAGCATAADPFFPPPEVLAK